MAARLERRQTWAAKAHDRSEQSLAAVRSLADQIPVGQPILVGHHSERRARRDAERIHSGMSRGVEELRLAQRHEARAEGIQRQLDVAVYSDDPDACERLRERIAEAEAERDRRKRANRLYRAGDAEGLAAMGLDIEELRVRIATLPSYDRQPWPAYSLTNIGARIRADKKRLAELEARQTPGA